MNNDGHIFYLSPNDPKKVPDMIKNDEKGSLGPNGTRI